MFFSYCILKTHKKILEVFFYYRLLNTFQNDVNRSTVQSWTTEILAVFGLRSDTSIEKLHGLTQLKDKIFS